MALCLNNSGYPVSLEIGKVYRVVPDEQAAAHGSLRIIDESGEDYAYSADRFYPLTLPPEVERVLLAPARVMPS